MPIKVLDDADDETQPCLNHSMTEDHIASRYIFWDTRRGGAGTILIVPQHRLFEDEILPQYFQKGNFSSFAKQLSQ